MSTLPRGDGALARLHSALAETVTVTGAGLTASARKAVRSDRRADDFMGAGRSTRQVVFEFRATDLPSPPTKAMAITDAVGTVWRVIDIERRGDVDAWRITVEKQA